MVSGTGHRPCKRDCPPACTEHLTAAGYAWLRAEQRRVVLKLKREHGTKVIVSGMALGFDMGLAHAALDMGLELWAYAPFPQQPDRWPPVLRAEWNLLRERATRVHYTGDAAGASYQQVVALLHQRNDEMLRDSVAVYAGWIAGKRRGGTASALRKAVRLGRPVVWSDPDRRCTSAPSGRRLAELLGR